MSAGLLSIVVPVFNEEENVEPLYGAVAPLLETSLPEYEFEFVFTDNHSSDKTFALLEELARKDTRIRVFRFSRNVGYQRSIYTGYLQTRGDAVIQLDCDLQDPPELIPQFVRKWEEGYKVVYGVRRSRKERWWIQTARKLFYRLIDALSEDALPHDAGDFRLVDRQVVEELRKIEDYQPYLRGVIASMGFEQIGIPYDRRERLRGESKFPLKQMVRLGMDGIMNHSLAPLRLATYTGLTVSALTFLGMIGYLIGKLVFRKNWPAGFTTLAMLSLLSLSLNACFLGIIGEYLGRIYQQMKKGSLAIIEKRIDPR